MASSHLRYKLGPKKALGSFLEEYVPGPWAVPWMGKVKSQGWMSVQAAIAALLGCSVMSDVLKTCIQFSGDVDTVAAIALAAGSCSTEIAQDLPVHPFDELENGQYGRDYIRSLDTQLMALFHTIHSTDKRENRLVDDGNTFFREELLPNELRAPGELRLAVTAISFLEEKWLYSMTIRISTTFSSSKEDNNSENRLM